MLPLQLTRIFDYQQPAADPLRNDNVRNTVGNDKESTSSPTNPTIDDRRKLTDRRSLERREKQQATFLNTRKMQGRRRSDGRRVDDNRSQYRPISLQG
ncbi:hypothetical protein H8K52_03290 [Undibacterium seohonense]|uniref:Uncharacterized protein n=1 Tax=Undibacterium seohonense TaxID=1344950 RepID=A0ABR6X1W1_9BURK|nr:hypothetical protein [Undibacterium seohonense]MBC3806371.1 hypothetical protein [Undibacterium seohonense]